MMKKGMDKESAKDLVMKIKSLESIKIPDLDDNDSFKAGLYHTTFIELRRIKGTITTPVRHIGRMSAAMTSAYASSPVKW